MTRLIVCLFLVAAVQAARHGKYEGHEIYRIGGPAEEFYNLQTKLDILSASPARSTSDQLEALVRLPPEEKQQWMEYFKQKSISFTLIVENLAEVLRSEDAKIASSRKGLGRFTKADESDEESSSSSSSSESDSSSDSNESNSSESSEETNSESSEEKSESSEETETESSEAEEFVWPPQWDTYYRHEEINAFIDDLGARYPNLVTVINAALSYEGRQIKYVRLSTSRFEDLRKPVIVIDAMMHAREWITTPVAMYIIDKLVVDIVDNDLINRLDWIIIPLANPDGYEYSIDEDRLWRKTRSRSHPGADTCPGVDGNRNFDHYWGTVANSADPCALIYEGPSPFSEPEVRVVRDAVQQHLNRAAMYISLHSYGNMILYAWGNNGTLPSNGLSLHLAGIQMAQAIDALALDKADTYIVGNAAQVLYFSTGTSRDWTRAVGVPLTYTLELPGYEYGFLVPPTYVSQVVTETWAGIAEGARYVLNLFS